MKKNLIVKVLLLFALVLLGATHVSAQEAYAYYTSDNTTLTFYYDTQKATRTGGTAYEMNDAFTNPSWRTDGTYESVTRVVFDPSFADARPVSGRMWFHSMTQLTSIEGIAYLNTSMMTHLDEMFRGCSNLTSIDVSHFNTSKAISMGQVFNGCTSLTALDLSSWDTSKVTFMRSLFYGCSALTTIYVGDGWKTDFVSISEGMFTGCTSLAGGSGTAYDASHVDAAYAHIDGGTDNPGYLSTAPEIEAYTFYTSSNTTLTFYCDRLKATRTSGKTYALNTIDNEPAWKTDGTNTSVTRVVFDPSFADARPVIGNYWFAGMVNLSTFVGMEYLNTSEMKQMTFMFANCNKLTSLDVSHFNTSKVTNMNYTFYSCMSLTELDLTGWDTSSATSMVYMFYYCNELKTLTLSTNFSTKKVTSFSNMFYHCTALTELDLTGWATAAVTNMASMFNRCSALKDIYVGDGWNTDQVTNSTDMFTDCISLVGGNGTEYDASHVDAAYAHIDGTDNPGYLTEKSTEAYTYYIPSDATLTFYYDQLKAIRTGGTAYALNALLDDPAWLTADIYSSVTKVVFDPSFADARPVTTRGWFSGMQRLSTIEGIENLNTSATSEMYRMFENCSSLTTLDLSHFDTSTADDLESMFKGCSNLTTLDLSSFNTSVVIGMSEMFNGCAGLTTIYVGNGWSTTSVEYSDDMFTDCTSLVGGSGTEYDASHTNATYAHIDGGASNPGYFSEKSAFAKGDVNKDGAVNVSDVTMLVSMILGNTAQNQMADVNKDGAVNVSDVTALVSIILGQ